MRRDTNPRRMKENAEARKVKKEVRELQTASDQLSNHTFPSRLK